MAHHSTSVENLLLALLPRRSFPVYFRYLATAAIVGVAALCRAGLNGSLSQYPLLLFIPAVFLCALLFDRGSGFFGTFFSAALAVFFFIEPRYSLAKAWNDWFALGIYVVIGCAIATVTEALRQTISKLEESEASKALLLEELAHRTRNDLALIQSTLTLQARAEPDPAVSAALKAAASRVEVIAQAQARLKGNGDEGFVDLERYLSALCGGLGDLLRGLRPIAVRLDCQATKVSSSEAVAIGLVVNELVTNAFKYAFPGDKGGAVDVEVTHLPSERIRIVVRDDGVGCPSDAAPGLGTRLVQLLAKQHGGELRRDAAGPGCQTTVEIGLAPAHRSP